MNTQLRNLLLLLALAMQCFFATGCTSTMKGVSQDYHRNEDKVENALK
jgi:predicted small secreted protein